MGCTFKKSGINNLNILFLFHRLLSNKLEKRIKNGSHQTSFLSGEQNIHINIYFGHILVTLFGPENAEMSTRRKRI